jgi:hypothetical protein
MDNVAEARAVRQSRALRFPLLPPQRGWWLQDDAIYDVVIVAQLYDAATGTTHVLARIRWGDAQLHAIAAADVSFSEGAALRLRAIRAGYARQCGA